MPTYDFRCEKCGTIFEDRVPLHTETVTCDWCLGTSRKQFTPNRNIIIPLAFKAVTQGFNSGSRGPDSAPYSDNNSVHAPQRQSFTQAFDANVKKAGGIG